MSGSHGNADSCAPRTPLSLAELDYELPPELIAQAPLERRDASRLLVYRRGESALEDRAFADLPRLLRAGDVLVRNDTRVFAARTFFRRATGGRLEVLFLRPARAAEGDCPGECWEALVRGRPRAPETLVSDKLGEAWPLTALRPLGGGRWLVCSTPPRPVLDLLCEAGVMPLPPYIHARLGDPERYQTTYARAVGSAAAPTAGLHFTPALDGALATAGVTVATVTLHVGLGTFAPLREETLAANALHSEAWEVEADVWSRLQTARAEGRRVVAVGSTSLRVLEHLALVGPGAAAGAPRGGDARGAGAPPALCGETSLFVTPGFEFRVVDALITNFHLPRTSLLALVMAFCGVAETRRLYAHAVASRYRFYSFGDAMLAL